MISCEAAIEPDATPVMAAMRHTRTNIDVRCDIFAILFNFEVSAAGGLLIRLPPSLCFPRKLSPCLPILFAIGRGGVRIRSDEGRKARAKDAGDDA